MQESKNLLKNLLHDRKKRNRVMGVATAFSLVVFLGVVWILHLPGITLNTEPACGYTAHTHSQECMGNPTLTCTEKVLIPHLHSEEGGCYQTDLVLLCEDETHEHTQECYQEDKTLVCSMEESHYHTDECYEPVCPEGMSDEDYANLNPVLVCTLPESHEHTTDCFAVEPVCGIPEHVHNNACYTVEKGAEKPEPSDNTPAPTGDSNVSDSTDTSAPENSASEPTGEPGMMDASGAEDEPGETAEPQAETTVYTIKYWGYPSNNGVRTLLWEEAVPAGETPQKFVLTSGYAPEGYEWDGYWYYDKNCTYEFDCSVPYTGQGADTDNILNLYPGSTRYYSITFVTYGERIPPTRVEPGKSINVDDYIPKKTGYTFAGWYLDETLTQLVSGTVTPEANMVFYAKWEPGLISFTPVRMLENTDSNDFTTEASIGTWYAPPGSTIFVTSAGPDTDGSYTHTVKWRLDGKEGNVTSDPEGNTPVQIDDVYNDYFVFNDTDSELWTGIYGTTEMPYSADTVVGDSGQTKIFFRYMRVRLDLVLQLRSTRGYFDIYQLVQDGKITGDATITPNESGNNPASGTMEGIEWTYVPTEGTTESDYNVYTLKNLKYGQTIGAYTGCDAQVEAPNTPNTWVLFGTTSGPRGKFPTLTQVLSSRLKASQ